MKKDRIHANDFRGRKTAAAVLASTLLAVTASFATISRYTFSGTGQENTLNMEWQETDIDFSKNPVNPGSSGHLNYATWTTPDSYSNNKFFDLKFNNAGSAGRCFDIVVYWTQLLAPTVFDWKMWANVSSNPTPNWVALSDDPGQANGFPEAHVWISGSVPDNVVRLRVSAYSQQNYANQGEGILRITDTRQNQADCESYDYNTKLYGVLRITGSEATRIRLGN